MDETITWESTPNHDGWGWDFINGYWSCAEWIAWHRALVAKFGKQEADIRWVNEYDKSTWGAAEISCSTNSNEFKSYAQSEGLADKSAILSRVYRAEVAVDDLTQGVTDPFAQLAKVLKWLPWIALIVLLIAAIYYLYSLGVFKAAVAR